VDDPLVPTHRLISIAQLPASRATAALTLLFAAAGCGGTAVHTASSTTQAATTHAPAAHAFRTHVTRARHAVDPGRLPQTDGRPTSGVALRARMDLLWSAVVSGSAARARAAFFPESAYRQAKAIWNPDRDFQSRIWANFARDVAAYHRYLGRSAPRTRLIAVDVATPSVGWVPAGVCENAVGYWHAPGTRLVYRDGRSEASVGIYSMISWRGQWYVIHLGPNTTPGSPGTVDSPQPGSGSPGYGPAC
jgi:hypothetical protein